MHSCSHHFAYCVVAAAAAAAVVEATATSPVLHIGPVVGIALDIDLAFAWELVEVDDRGVVAWVADAAAAAAAEIETSSFLPRQVA